MENTPKKKRPIFFFLQWKSRETKTVYCKYQKMIYSAVQRSKRKKNSAHWSWDLESARHHGEKERTGTKRKKQWYYGVYGTFGMYHTIPDSNQNKKTQTHIQKEWWTAVCGKFDFKICTNDFVLHYIISLCLAAMILFGDFALLLSLFETIVKIVCRPPTGLRHGTFCICKTKHKGGVIRGWCKINVKMVFTIRLFHEK